MNETELTILKDVFNCFCVIAGSTEDTVAEKMEWLFLNPVAETEGMEKISRPDLKAFLKKYPNGIDMKKITPFGQELRDDIAAYRETQITLSPKYPLLHEFIVK